MHPFATRDGLPLPIRCGLTVHRAEWHFNVSLVVLWTRVVTCGPVNRQIQHPSTQPRRVADSLASPPTLPTQTDQKQRRRCCRRCPTEAPAFLAGLPSTLSSPAYPIPPTPPIRPLAARSACPNHNQREGQRSRGPSPDSNSGWLRGIPSLSCTHGITSPRAVYRMSSEL